MNECRHYWVEIYPMLFQCKNCGKIIDLFEEDEEK